MKMRAPRILRWFGKKTISLVVTSPYLGTMMEVSRHYLATGLTSDQLEDVTHEQALSLMAAHGKSICRAVASAWLNGKYSIRLFAGLLSRYMMWHCKPVEILTVLQMILIYGGTKDFMNTTRSVRLLKATTPSLGHQTKGS